VVAATRRHDGLRDGTCDTGRELGIDVEHASAGHFTSDPQAADLPVQLPWRAV
jgi:hypothetical protein